MAFQGHYRDVRDVPVIFKCFQERFRGFQHRSRGLKRVYGYSMAFQRLLVVTGVFLWISRGFWGIPEDYNSVLWASSEFHGRSKGFHGCTKISMIKDVRS